MSEYLLHFCTYFSCVDSYKKTNVLLQRAKSFQFHVPLYIHSCVKLINWNNTVLKHQQRSRVETAASIRTAENLSPLRAGQKINPERHQRLPCWSVVCPVVILSFFLLISSGYMYPLLFLFFFLKATNGVNVGCILQTCHINSISFELVMLGTVLSFDMVFGLKMYSYLQRQRI